MARSIFDIPTEIFQLIVLAATTSSLGPPTDLYNCLLTCRTFRDALSPTCAAEIYAAIFSHQFDAGVITCCLSAQTVRENASQELSRRLLALKIFQRQDVDHLEVADALLVAFLMLENSETGQKNVKQLLRAGLPQFLDLYLEHQLFDATDKHNSWATLSTGVSLALALSWGFTSQSSITREGNHVSDKMRNILRPLVFAASRYPLSHNSESSFVLGNTSSLGEKTSPLETVLYFGAVRGQLRPPAAFLYAALLYFVRTESVAPFSVPKHLKWKTRDQGTLAGYSGLCVEDYEHFYRHCRTRFSESPSSSSHQQSILGEFAAYKVGTFAGRWQGSQMLPFALEYKKWSSESAGPSLSPLYEARSPVYISLEEHYCYEGEQPVPKGNKSHWVPDDLLSTPTKEGMLFTSTSNTCQTTYETYRPGQPFTSSRRVIDVMITGKTDERFRKWGGGTRIVGRVRLEDGLIVFRRFSPDHTNETDPLTQVFRGYAISSQNLVGRLQYAENPTLPCYEGVFSLSKELSKNL